MELSPLQQQGANQHGFQPDHPQTGEEPRQIAQNRGLERIDQAVFRREVLDGDAEAVELLVVENMAIGTSHHHGQDVGGNAGKHLNGQLARGDALGPAGNQLAANGAVSHGEAPQGEDGGRAVFGDEAHAFRNGQILVRCRPEIGQIEHQILGADSGKRPPHFFARQAHQIAEADAIPISRLERRKPIQVLLTGGGHVRDQRHLPGLGPQSQRGIQGFLDGQGLVDAGIPRFSFQPFRVEVVGPAEDDRHAGKQGIPVFKKEIHRVVVGGDDGVHGNGRVPKGQGPGQPVQVAGAEMPLGVHVFQIELDSLGLQQLLDGLVHLAGMGKAVVIGMEHQDPFVAELRFPRLRQGTRSGQREQEKAQPEPTSATAAFAPVPVWCRPIMHGRAF
ncbi:MAG: hypothetical protein ACLFRG_12775 [Desulfococcaceae bacterium]